MDIIPIWKDYPITISTTEDYVDYTIRQGSSSGTVIYSGRAFKLPGATSVRIVPNEICAPYVAVTGAPPIPTPIAPDDDLGIPIPVQTTRMARLFTLTEANGTTHEFVFQADYSHNMVPHATNAPITGRVDRTQVLFVAGYKQAIISEFMIRLFNASGDQINEFNYPVSGGYAMGFYLRGKLFDGAARILAYAQNSMAVYYDLVDACDPYILYYVNAYGGWDSLLVDGTVKRTDDYSRTTFKQAYSTQSKQNGVLERGTVCLQNDITRKYTLVTGWLTDDQASRMHHLLGSTNVYLLDRDSNQYLPVVLTNSSCEYKTFRNQGAKLVNYTIEATVAQNFTRR